MEEIRRSIAAEIHDLFGLQTKVELSRPDENFGDYSTNIALQLADKVGKPPREIAEAIAGKLQHEVIAKVEVAGPGFINLFVQDQILVKQIQSQLPLSLQGKKILVEYSDPNPLKPLHAGHLYTTLVGDMIARLIENAGAETIRLNYGGDVGLHVAKSMWGILHSFGGENPEKLNEIPSDTRAAWLGDRYVEGNNAYEDDENAKHEIIALNKRVYELHGNNDHESAFAQIYWACRQWSYDYFTQLYRQLEVKQFDRFIPESEVTPLGLQTVLEQLQRGIYKRSEEAVVFNGEQYGLHTRVFINSEGLPTYEAKDVGLSLTKWQDYHFDQSIIITAHEQEQYMQVVLKSIEQFAPEPAQRTLHLTHGVVKLQGGVKMSSRKGNVVTAMEILEAAREAGQGSGTNPNEQTILAAVKYAFAKNRIGGDIIYDPQESVALEGNSGPYLQYAHARACSILRKAGKASEVEINELTTDERRLVRKLSEYQEVVARATGELMPHHIAVYLYELAQNFNTFYEHNRVLGDDRQAIRLSLVKWYADKLKAGLELLGIHAPEQM